MPDLKPWELNAIRRDGRVMDTTYILSFRHKALLPSLKRRPWWNLFGRDKIEWAEGWQHKVAYGITESEAQLLIHKKMPPTTGMLLVSRLFKDVCMMQLENASVTTKPYLQTSFEAVHTNILSRSE